MANFLSHSGASSRVGSVADLDGYTFPPSDYYSTSSSSYYISSNHDEFGFDPPTSNSAYRTLESTYSPDSQSNPVLLPGWPGFETEEDSKRQLQIKFGIQQSSLPASQTLDRTQTTNLPNISTAISRFGQVTPPRSNSAGSVDMIEGEPDVLPKNATVARRKKSKVHLSEFTPSPTNTKPSRRRKASRKATLSISEPMDAAEADKRKNSLEKNRVAAAKCRINKKEKTEQMQRDSHEKSVQNAILRDTVMRMKAEIEHMNTLLLAHSNCEGCRRPDEVHKHIRQTGNDYFSHRPGQQYNSYGAMPEHMHQSNQGHMMQDDFFARATMDHDPMMLSNPPLPEYNQPADFVLETPHPAD
jgi:hypothetical protein